MECQRRAHSVGCNRSTRRSVSAPLRCRASRLGVMLHRSRAQRYALPNFDADRLSPLARGSESLREWVVAFGGLVHAIAAQTVFALGAKDAFCKLHDNQRVRERDSCVAPARPRVSRKGPRCTRPCARSSSAFGARWSMRNIPEFPHTEARGVARRVLADHTAPHDHG